MSQPHDCPIPLGQSCAHVSTITVLQTNITTIMEHAKETRDDLRDIKKTINSIAMLEQTQNTLKESLQKAFVQIEVMQENIDDHKIKFNRYDVMEKVAYFLWTSLAAGVGSIALKVFSVI